MYRFKTIFMFKVKKVKKKSIIKDSFERIHFLLAPQLATSTVTEGLQGAALFKRKFITVLIGPNRISTHLIDPLLQKVLVVLNIREKRVKVRIAAVGSHALQKISLFTSHHLWNQKTTAQIS